MYSEPEADLPAVNETRQSNPTFQQGDFNLICFFMLFGYIYVKSLGENLSMIRGKISQQLGTCRCFSPAFLFPSLI